MSLKELPLPSIASLRAIAALKNTHLALVRPARIGLGFESAGGNQKSLADVELALGGPGQVSLPYSLRWLLDVMSGLAVLHRTLGFVHGEVQPEHVVLGDDGIGRLLPVVRAHWVRGEQRAPERLYYLSPEKLLGDHVDSRSDIFSVGVLLWEAITGQRLLEAYTVESVVSRLMSGSIPRARAPEGEAWTAPLALVAERAIAVDPARRFASITEMKAAIEGPSLRYLASTPGMVALYQHPEQRLRGRARDSAAPQSQRATLPPGDGRDRAGIDHASGRLSRPNLSSVDLEEELTRPKVTLPPPTVRKVSHVDTLVGVPPPAQDRDSSPHDELTTPFARVESSIPAPAPAAAPKSSPRAAPKSSPRAAPKSSPHAAPSKPVNESEAKTVVQPLSQLLKEAEAELATTVMRSPVVKHSLTPPYFRSPVSTAPPPAPASTSHAALHGTQPLAPTRVTSIPPPPSAVPPPAAAPPVADPRQTLRLSSPPAPTHRPSERRITESGFPPMIAPQALVDPRRTLPLSAPSPAPLSSRAEVVTLDPSIDSFRPRRRRGGWWLLLGAAAAIGLFAARPWLARHVAASGDAAGDAPTAPKLDPTPPRPTTAKAPARVDDPAPAPSAESSTPTLPSAEAEAEPRGAAPRTGGRREPHVVIHDRIDPTVKELAEAPPPAREPEPVTPPEPEATPPPPPKEEPPPAPPPPPKPKPAPASDADRYGI